MHKHYYVHRLVAIAFIDNPFEYQEVNHKDENKLNNNVNNLEWCTRKYNNTYGTRLEKVKASNQNNKTYKKVLCVETGIVYNSATEAARMLNLQQTNITACCRGRLSTTGGYHWQYEENT